MRILFAWQLGANYGHLMTDLPIAESLRQLGHDVSFAVADARVAGEVLSPAGFRFVDAPRLTRPSTPVQPMSYADILNASGFGDDQSLENIAGDWSTLIQSTAADVVVADHAPHAVLAARFLRVPCVMLGTGFTIPPPVTPLPPIRPWETGQAHRLGKVESQMVKRINSLSAQRGTPALAHLFELFSSAAALLTTFPELDPYGPRIHGTYAGPLTSDATSIPVHWEDGPQRRVLAYLRPSVPKLGAILTALEDSGVQAICVVPGATPELQRHFAATGVTLLDRPVPLPPLLHEADVVISYGGAGMIASSLMCGVPLLLAPQNAEQYLGAVQVEKLAAGILVGPRHADADVAPALERLLASPHYREGARRFAAKHAAFDRREASDAAASMIVGCAQARP